MNAVLKKAAEEADDAEAKTLRAFEQGEQGLDEAQLTVGAVCSARFLKNQAILTTLFESPSTDDDHEPDVDPEAQQLLKDAEQMKQALELKQLKERLNAKRTKAKQDAEEYVAVSKKLAKASSIPALKSICESAKISLSQQGPHSVYTLSRRKDLEDEWSTQALSTKSTNEPPKSGYFAETRAYIKL